MLTVWGIRYTFFTDTGDMGNDVLTLDQMTKKKVDEANNHKRARDKYALDAKNWASKRDLYRDRSKQMYAEAQEIKKQRDVFNAKVKELKTKREECREKAADLKGSRGPEYFEARAKADDYHQQMLSCNEKGQAAHQRYVELIEQSNKDRAAADDAHNKSVECRKAADEEHRLFVEAVKAMNELRDNIPDFDLEDDA